MKSKTVRIICFAVMGVVLAALLAGNIVCGYFSGIITTALCGTGTSFDGEKVAEAQALGDAMCQKLQADGVVMLKNENDTLPLRSDETNINVFGYSSRDDKFLLRGVGSGSSTIQDEKKETLLTALDKNGFKCNPDLIDMYNGYNANRSNYNLAEPPLSNYTDELMTNAKNFSDVALVVLSRNGGENIGEIPKTQPGDNSRSYLNISKAEEDMLGLVKANFEKVIVILNTCNIMHTGFLDDAEIGAALYVGITGQSGTMSIAKILKGEISPSGKTTDTYVYTPEYDPSYANSVHNSNHIQYVEDIYFGYKWYETADAEGYFNNVVTDFGEGYKGVVQYPFGFGLSYTEFEWEVTGVTGPDNGVISQDTKVTITLDVTNTGDEKGKDVIELYYTPEYTDGGIEKAHVNLLDFAKTAELEPGQTQQNVTLSFTAYDLAAYDCYDKNKNGSAAYELDEGDYTIKLMTDAHTIAECDKAELVLSVKNTIVFDKDPVTDTTVENRFTGSGAYAGVPIDGSTVGAETVYMTRSDFAGTFPKAHAKTPNNSAEIRKANSYVNTSWDVTEAPAQGIPGDLRLVTLENGSPATLDELNGGKLSSGDKLQFNEELMDELASDYDGETWERLLNQLTNDELKRFVEIGGFRSQSAVSIGKPLCWDYDGPAGFNENTQTGKNADSSKWTAYPSESLIGSSWNKAALFEMGCAMGKDAEATGLNGWYAPGVNLHRSAYTARNYEYYSEDGVISGKLAAELILGAKATGLYCYIKHYALSEPGPNPRELNTWITEQNLRENYLRPFEIAVKYGKSNGVMTAFNRVGGTWAGASYPLNVSILREEWGFKGSVITDWSSGSSYMNPEQGIRAGNDFWLNPNNRNDAPIDMSDPTTVSCARRATKNIIYTYVDTWKYWNENKDKVDERYVVELGVRTKTPVFPWWIFIVVGIDLVVVGGFVFWTVMLLKGKKKEAAN